jgi:hypothetical protein
MEANWMRKISNSSICNWFYIFYVANVIVITLVVVASLYVMIFKNKDFTASNVFFALLQLVVAGTNTLFFYLICDRSLKPTA